MNIREALSIKTLPGDKVTETDPAKLAEADALSIEALRLLLELRSRRFRTINTPLPGETHE